MAIRTTEIRSLTGLRGVAALMIVLTHYQIVSTKKAYLAVDLFFVLSGFVMALTYSRAFQATGGFSTYASFLWKRFARVYPLYFVITALTVVFPGALGAFSFLQIVLNLLLVQQFGFDLVRPDLGVSIVGPAWSISAELVAYLLFPVVLGMCLRKSLKAAAVVAFVAAAIIIMLAFLPFDHPDQYAVLDRTGRLGGVARCLAGFSLGVIGYRAWIANIHVSTLLSVAAAIVIGIASYFLMGDPVIVLVFPLLVVGSASPANITYKALGTTPFHFIGEVSYALYLIHILTYLHFKQFTDALMVGLHMPYARAASLSLLVGIDLTLAAAALFTIEKPARRFLRHLASRRRIEPITDEPAAP